MAMDTRTELKRNMAASEEVFPSMLILSTLWIAGGLMTRRLACFLFILDSKNWLATCQYRESAEDKFALWIDTSLHPLFCCCCCVKKLNLTKAKQQQGNKNKICKWRRMYCGSWLKGHSPSQKGSAGACSWDTSLLGKPATESSVLAVSLSSLFGVFPIHTLVGVTHLHGVYTSLELLPETHPEAYIKGESTFSVGNDPNHDSISATVYCFLQSEAMHSLLHLSFNTDGAFYQYPRDSPSFPVPSALSSYCISSAFPSLLLLRSSSSLLFYNKYSNIHSVLWLAFKFYAFFFH